MTLLGGRRSHRHGEAPAASATTVTPAEVPAATPASAPRAPTPLGASLAISARRAGQYRVLDTLGSQVGRIFGDYVVGFTVEYGEKSQWVPTLEAAKALAVELETAAAEPGTPQEAGTGGDGGASAGDGAATRIA
jgi:hypothetical protein